MKLSAQLVKTSKVVCVWGIGVAILYSMFIWGISTNPTGFYVDESCLAYNGHLIATTGKAENGASFPLFFQCYTESFIQYMHPTNIYLLAAMYLFISPSVVSARILAATTVFIAMLLLGLLAARISGLKLIGVFVTVTAVSTPRVFEISRLVMETFVLVLSIVLFLFWLYNARMREKWKSTDSLLLALALALITYSYPSGRVLGPAFAFGLLIFATSRPALWSVIKTWVLYSITLIPFVFVYLTNEEVLTKRFREVSFVLPEKSWTAIAIEFVTNYFTDIGPGFLLVTGDTLQRHHVGGMGEIFVATFVLALSGVILILLLHRHDPWWRFILFGLIVSVVPGAVTVHRHHAFRLLALPIFLLILTVPVLSFLIGAKEHDLVPSENRTSTLISNGWHNLKAISFSRLIILSFLLLSTLGQAVYFQVKYRELMPKFGSMFDASYPRVLNVALAQSSRPIYLKDGRYGGVAYIHAYWYGAIKGVDPSNFVHLSLEETPPPGSVVLSSDLGCTNCSTIFREDNFNFYRTR